MATALAIDKTIHDDSFQATLAVAISETIAPTVDAKGTASDRARQMLCRAVENRSNRLTLGETLGEGGMGLVLSAKQSDLGREVAVKTLRPEIDSSQAVVAMLQEAWVTGTLEHPNIVPVYYVDSDENGKPLIVLKRIEGTVWSGLIGNPDAVEARFGATDIFEWNLEVLDSVINAMRYAHQRGVVHRDLKPDNVMVGEFGEVYVVDWGIAVALVDDGETLLPPASEVDRMAGTPAFMAPEMLGSPVDERTDVYLLGGLLYTLVNDRPPHIGQSMTEIIASIRHSSPEFPRSVPDALSAICRKAMAPDPADRYQSADEMGSALREFRSHRSSLRLSNRAQHTLETLRHRVSADADSAELQELLSACRFGFQSSLEAWKENPEAAKGLGEAIELVAGLELRRGHPKVAASILRELETPSAELAAQVDEAMAAYEQEEKRIALQEQQLDKGAGKRTRVFVLGLLGTAWIGLDLWGQLSGNVDRYGTHTNMLIGSLISLALLGLVIYLDRATLMRTVLNRQLGGALLALLATQALVSGLAPSLGMSPAQAQVLWMMVWSTVATMVATTIERRMLPMAIVAGLGFALGSIWMNYRIYAMMVVTGSMIANAAWIWWPESSEKKSPSAPAKGS
jgi:serine/threonine-protein kinase